MKIIALLLIALFGVPLSAAAFDVGPPVGSTMPPLVAKDAAGMVRDLTAVAGKKGVVLVFFRSARWCPFCQAQLISLKEVQGPLAQRGYNLAAISYDPTAALADFAAKRSIGYTLLSDNGSKMIDAMGLRDPQYPKGSFADGVPRPSIFVVSQRGIIVAKLAEEGFKVRPTNEAILQAVNGVKSPAK